MRNAERDSEISFCILHRFLKERHSWDTQPTRRRVRREPLQPVPPEQLAHNRKAADRQCASYDNSYTLH